MAVMAVLVGKLSVHRGNCAPLTGKCTLNRLELSRPQPTCRAKIAADMDANEAPFVALFLDVHRKTPSQIALDLDATDDPLHGHRVGRLSRGYCDSPCYLPFYILCGRDLLEAKLLRSNVDAAGDAIDEASRIVEHSGARWPRGRIVLCPYSGFCHETLMPWCETNRLITSLAWRATYGWYRRSSWAMTAVDGQPESDALCHRPNGPRPEPIHASSSHPWNQPRSVPAGCMRIYSAGRDRENRIKECRIDLFADRTAAGIVRANPVCL